MRARGPSLSLRTGFTLVEVLIAAALMGIIGLAIAETLRAARDADRKLQLRSERRAQDRVILERIARDIRAIVPYIAGTAYDSNAAATANYFSSGIVGTQQVGGGTEQLSRPEEQSAFDAEMMTAGGTAPVGLWNERDTLQLAIIPGARRFGDPWPFGTGTIQQVTWSVDDDPNTPERGLIRQAITVQSNATITGIPEPPEQIASNVCGIRFQYFDGTQWQPTWSSVTNADAGTTPVQTIPQAIQVDVAVRDPDGTIRWLCEVVAPFLGRQTQQVAASTAAP
ncbi:MAG TPA: prepilin-type N-terminal cleavage/methylation domain-containing protein [Planctomycetota bacterium]|nr:prepilin-type N-terminal cleavage/methylation domain-containing protein [Planctomycetota bacterium]